MMHTIVGMIAFGVVWVVVEIIAGWIHAKMIRRTLEGFARSNRGQTYDAER